MYLWKERKNQSHWRRQNNKNQTKQVEPKNACDPVTSFLKYEFVMLGYNRCPNDGHLCIGGQSV